MLKLFLFLCLVLQINSSVSRLIRNKYQHYLGFRSVNAFREYLRIDTSKPENIDVAVDFWKRQLTDAGIPYKIYKPAGLPIIVGTVLGSEPSLPSIMLNTHIDVVTADPTEWKYPPFAAYMDINGDIYGRGAQDTKDVGIQHLEAIRKLKENNVTFLRTVHLTYMPDEETSGKYGMKAFVETPEFKSLNIGFALDEGVTSPDDALYGTFVDRRPWQMQFLVRGAGGHGFMMPDETAMERTQRLINKIMKYRATQKKIKSSKEITDFTGYTSINVNMLEAGQAINIIPSLVKLSVDMRLATDADIPEMESLVQSWLEVAGNTSELIFTRKEIDSGVTAVDDSNPYWVCMRDTLTKMGIELTPVVCPATSDMLKLRNLGIPAIGFATKTRTIARIHAKNEYQNVEIFVKGIDIFAEVIKNLANLEKLEM